MDKILGPFERERCILQDRLSDLDGLVHDLIRRNSIVDQAKLLCLRRFDLLAGQQKFHAILAVDVASKTHDAAR